MFPTKLKDPQCTGPFYPKLKKQHYVYIFEEFRNWKPAGDIELILAVDVDGRHITGFNTGFNYVLINVDVAQSIAILIVNHSCY